MSSPQITRMFGLPVFAISSLLQDEDCRWKGMRRRLIALPLSIPHLADVWRGAELDLGPLACAAVRGQALTLRPACLVRSVSTHATMLEPAVHRFEVMVRATQMVAARSRAARP